MRMKKLDWEGADFPLPLLCNIIDLYTPHTYCFKNLWVLKLNEIHAKLDLLTTYKTIIDLIDRYE